MQRRPESNSQYGEQYHGESPLQRLQATFLPLLTKKEAAEFYSVTERTLDRWLRDGVLPADAKVVIGGTVRFRSEVLLNSIAEK